MSRQAHLSAVAEEKHAIEHADGDLSNLTSRRVMRLDRLKRSNTALKRTRERQLSEVEELKRSIALAQEELRLEQEKRAPAAEGGTVAAGV